MLKFKDFLNEAKWQETAVKNTRSFFKNDRNLTKLYLSWDGRKTITFTSSDKGQIEAAYNWLKDEDNVKGLTPKILFHDDRNVWAFVAKIDKDENYWRTSSYEYD